MSDPLQRLREIDDAQLPDAGVVRERARRIRRRRTQTMGSMGGAAMVILVVAAVLVGRPGDRAIELADPDLTPVTPPAFVEPDGGLDESVAATEGLADASPVPRSRAVVRDARPTDAVERPGVGATTGSGTGSAANLEVTLEVPQGPVSPQQPVVLTLQVCNRTSGAVESRFDDGQRYDFEVFRYGTSIWRWSEGRAFPQATGIEHWEPGACRKWSEQWPKATREGERTVAGRYEAVGILAGPDQRSTEPASFCLTACP